MTTDEAEVLMNKYFDDETSDGELQSLFTYLGTSAEGRVLFSSMKHVHESLNRTPDFKFPEGIDKKLAALIIRGKEQSMISRTFTVSLRSTVYSACAVLIIGLFMYAAGSYQEQVMGSQYRSTISSLQQRSSTFVDSN